jgi:lon-related putative ATP-dependent protease
MGRILTGEDLRRTCDPGKFGFKTTEDLEPLKGIIGQERALDAIEFGLSLRSLGFNIYVLGDSGTGRTSAIRSFISQKAERETVPTDWCYVYNFAESAEPLAISLKPGQGSAFQKYMQGLVASLKVEIPKVFESKEYKKRKNAITEEVQKRQKEIFATLEVEAQGKGFSIRAVMGGFTLVAMTDTGEPLTEESFNSLSAEKKERIRENGKQVQERVDDAVRTVKKEEKAADEAMKELERNAALSVLGPMIEEIKREFSDNGKLIAYLDAAGEDVLANIEDFKSASEEQPSSPVPFLKLQKQEPDFSRYSVNLLVNNSGGKGSPCVFESNPTYSNLFGRIEYRYQLGTAMTDFTMIKAGSLHKANGGYLVINALDLLKNLFSYDALKRAIKNVEVKIEDVWEQYRVITTAAMKPEPIPLSAKIILIGNPEIYHLLFNLDEEYRELFKVKADFDNRMQRSDENMRKYAGFVSRKTREEGLLPFDASGVAGVVEYGSRLAEHQEKLSAKFSDISNLLREAHFWASKEGGAVVSGSHVEKALVERIHRHGRIEDRMREVMAEGTLIVETAGERMGQVNGLAVIDMGDYSFGKPSRITATVYAGKAGVVNIERETKLSGKIHEKAVLILSNYLGRKYAVRRPLSITASITFEQLYGMIEGDSATCAELYTLLSAIAGVPLRQDIAVTGSMDQNGIVQPVGGLNEKIEGFFELCRLRGLTGSQGVVIPARSILSLMLRKDVVDAARNGTFRVHAIDRVEEGIEILTGMQPGEQGPDGRYPEGTFNRLVADRLEELREAAKEEKEAGKKPAPADNAG